MRVKLFKVFRLLPRNQQGLRVFVMTITSIEIRRRVRVKAVELLLEHMKRTFHLVFFFYTFVSDKKGIFMGKDSKLISYFINRQNLKH